MSGAKHWKNQAGGRGGRTPVVRVHTEAYSGAFRRAFDSLPAIDQRMTLDRASAGDRLAELERHPWPRRLVLVANLIAYQSLGVAEALLRRSRRAWTDDAQEAECFAQLALAVLEALSADAYPLALVHDHQARAWAYVANARRIRSELDRVEEPFRRAEEHLQSGTGDASLRAQLFDLRASFARANRRFDEAEMLLRRVISIHREVGDRHLEGRALVGLAFLRYALGEPGEALELLERAAPCIDGERDPHLRFALEKNRALYLSAVGRTDEARARLPEVRRLARKLGTRLDHLRLLWVSALIHRDRGRLELAELALRRVRDGFVAERLPFDAALAALDLAALYLAAGRLEATALLARETAAIFSALDVQHELLAALALFHQAAERRSITVAWVEGLAGEVRRRGSAVEGFGRDEPGR